MAGEIVAFTYNEVGVRQNSQSMVNLTDMWRSHGAIKSQRPDTWQRHEETIQFVAGVAQDEKATTDSLFSVTLGRNGGTYAHWQIALAYAKYLSPEFHIHVNKVYRAWAEGTLQPRQPVDTNAVRAALPWLLRSTLWRDEFFNLTNRYEPKYYCVIMVMGAAMGTVEDEIFLHEMKTYESDRMDGSFGHHWGKEFSRLLSSDPDRFPERRTNPKVTMEYDVNGRKVNVCPWLYPNDTYALCREFFLNVYIPYFFPDYLKNKSTFKRTDPVVKYSVADNVTQRISGTRAALPEKYREAINAYRRSGVKRITASMRAKHQLENQQGKLFE